MYSYSELKFHMFVNVAFPLYVSCISFPYFSFIYLIIVAVFGAKCKLCSYSCKKKKSTTDCVSYKKRVFEAIEICAVA